MFKIRDSFGNPYTIADLNQLDEFPQGATLPLLDLSNNKEIKRLPKNLNVEGLMTLSNSSLRKLPEGMVVASLDLCDSHITRIPATATIQGVLAANSILVPELGTVRCRTLQFMTSELTKIDLSWVETKNIRVQIDKSTSIQGIDTEELVVFIRPASVSVSSDSGSNTNSNPKSFDCSLSNTKFNKLTISVGGLELPNYPFDQVAIRLGPQVVGQALEASINVFNTSLYLDNTNIAESRVTSARALSLSVPLIQHHTGNVSFQGIANSGLKLPECGIIHGDLNLPKRTKVPSSLCCFGKINFE